MGRRSLAIAILVAAVLVAIAIAFRILRAEVDASAGGARGGTALFPVLFAAAGLCTAGLLRRPAPAGAWLATVGAAGIGALEILAAVRAQQSLAERAAWPVLVLLAEAALLGAAAIAAGYAIASRADAEGSPSWPGRAWRLVVLAGLAAVAITGAWLTVQELNATGVALDPASANLPPLRISARLAAAYVAVMALAGIWRDLRGPLGRARTRSSSARELPRALADELLPGTVAARRHGRDEERARLAADLHALVLPDLRRAALAAEAAESGGEGAGQGAAELRQAVAGVERLMHERQSVVLEEYGLVAALEWLAERTQDHHGLDVDVELDGAGVGDRSAVPPAVGRAAFRVALLAMDNVVRHAGAARATLRLTVDAGEVRLTIADDGMGIHGPAAATGMGRRSGRGLIDMRAAAADVGASLDVERPGRGTAIAMRWARPA